jgi:tetrahydromethanopterin S-methyltransferase subunit G
MMNNVSWEQFGVIGLIVFFAYQVLDKQFHFFDKYKKGGNDDALENNTVAIEKLTQTQTELLNFLKTQAAVDQTKAQQNEKQMDEIGHKLDTVISMVSTHMTQCQSTCLKR